VDESEFLMNPKAHTWLNDNYTLAASGQLTFMPGSL
jgi:hypothetical protein